MSPRTGSLATDGQMRWLKDIAPPALVVAAFAVALAMLLSDHSSDYGRVALPQGGAVELPEGSVTVFYDEPGADPSRPLAHAVTFSVAPAAGGPPLEEKPTSKDGDVTNGVERSEDVGSLGSVAKLDVPASGSYVVTGRPGLPAGSSLSFGTNAFGAIARHRWLLGGLLLAALIVALIPAPPRRHRADAGWSSDSRAPYA